MVFAALSVAGSRSISHQDNARGFDDIAGRIPLEFAGVVTDVHGGRLHLDHPQTAFARPFQFGIKTLVAELLTPAFDELSIGNPVFAGRWKYVTDLRRFGFPGFSPKASHHATNAACAVSFASMAA